VKGTVGSTGAARAILAAASSRFSAVVFRLRAWCAAPQQLALAAVKRASAHHSIDGAADKAGSCFGPVFGPTSLS